MIQFFPNFYKLERNIVFFTMNNNNSTYKRLGDYIREVDVRNVDERLIFAIDEESKKAVEIGLEIRGYRL